MVLEFQYTFLGENDQVSFRNFKELIKETGRFSSPERIQKEIFDHKNWLIRPDGYILVVDLTDSEERKALWIDTKTSSVSPSFDFDRYFQRRKTGGVIFLTAGLAETDSDRIKADIHKALDLLPEYKACLFVIEAKSPFELKVNKDWRLKCLTDSWFELAGKNIESKKDSDYIIWSARKPLKRTSELLKEIANYKKAEKLRRAGLGTRMLEDLNGNRQIVKATMKGEEKSKIGREFDETNEARILTETKAISEIPKLSDKAEKLLRAMERQEIQRARDEKKFLFTDIGETVKTDTYCRGVENHPDQKFLQTSLETGWIDERKGEEKIFYDEFCPYCGWSNYKEIRVKAYKRMVDGKLVRGWVVKEDLW